MMNDLSMTHTVPLTKWIQDDSVIKFWGDNVDTQMNVRDLRADNQGGMMHNFSMIVGRSRTPAPELSHKGHISSLDEVTPSDFLPTIIDLQLCKSALVKIISRKITKHITGLTRFSKIVPKHILHKYSREMARKSEVFALDIMKKNECLHIDMVDILKAYQAYLGEGYDESRRVVSGGDYLTCERQRGAQLSTVCGATVSERLGVLEPVNEDWHCLVTFLNVSLSCASLTIVNYTCNNITGCMEASVEQPNERYRDTCLF